MIRGMVYCCYTNITPNGPWNASVATSRSFRSMSAPARRARFDISKSPMWAACNKDNCQLDKTLPSQRISPSHLGCPGCAKDSRAMPDPSRPPWASCRKVRPSPHCLGADVLLPQTNSHGSIGRGCNRFPRFTSARASRSWRSVR